VTDQTHSSLNAGSDVGASLIRDKGILDTKAYEYEASRSIDISQATRLTMIATASLRVQAQHEQVAEAADW
jgi:aminopeptidase C